MLDPYGLLRTLSHEIAGPGFSLLFVVYLVIGGIVAASHHYWSNVHSLKAIGSALLATVLWPLILLGINLHIH